ncbi:hypothetical protein BDF19DRAFT_435309 [Syncephalis fuscata]|nr:hypothetical protein BDF19DRAFT_435309 [Syncephalis fuscata]
MPVIDFTNLNHTEWTKDAATKWGIPLHPLGEINTIDFLMNASGDIKEQRIRFTGAHLEVVLTVVMLYLFGRNSIVAGKMAILQPCNIFSWCCLIPSSMGVCIGIVSALVHLGILVNCRMVVWSMAFGQGVAMACNSLIILRKTYLVLYQKKWVIYFSIPLMLAQPFYAFMMIYSSFFTIEAKLGCTIYYTHFFVWYWIVINGPINIFFSAIFCKAALQQYRTFGSIAWKRLAQEGIQTLCLAILCNIICCIFVISHLNTANSDVFFAVDWMIVTTILVNHCQRMRSSTSLAHRPMTHHMLHLSQIATAKSITNI